MRRRETALGLILLHLVTVSSLRFARPGRPVAASKGMFRKGGEAYFAVAMEWRLCHELRSFPRRSA